MRLRLQALRREDGHTLVELLVAMIFIGVLFGMFALVVSSSLRHNDEVQEQSTLQTEARSAIDGLAADLRSAYSGEDGVAPIESMGAGQITFLSPDRAEPFHLRRVSYRLLSGKLERALATSTDTDGAPWIIPALGPYSKVAGSVTNTTVFRYFDANDAVTAVPADVARVEITLTVATKVSPARQYTYTSSVTLRAEA